MTDTFDTFWSDYPRKEGKEYARKCYAKAVKAHGAPTISAGLSRFNAKMISEGRDKKHIMQASRFLNQKVFLDSEEDLVSRMNAAAEPVGEIVVGGEVFRYPKLLALRYAVRRGHTLDQREWDALKAFQDKGNWPEMRLPPRPAPLPSPEERRAYLNKLKSEGFLS